ncbi:hypothetical protein Stok01_01844 [Sulfurisphaera tokodaii]|nr:hypothetical protein [Sulfurisphaera tokodaii]HII75249.1 hypothetical protein [Sulfurisphaera tokodaii]
MLISGVLAIFIPITSMISVYMINSSNVKQDLYDINLIDLFIDVISIIFFSLILSITIIGGIIGIINKVVNIIVLYYYLTSLHSITTLNSFLFYFNILSAILDLVALIIIFIKILNINKEASIIGFIGVIFYSIGHSLFILIPYLNNTHIIKISPELSDIIGISVNLGTIWEILLGIGLILAINIADSIFFKDTGEAKIRFISQTKGYIRTLILNDRQAISYIPRYVNIGINSIDAEFPRSKYKGGIITILLDNGFSITIRPKIYSNKP